MARARAKAMGSRFIGSGAQRWPSVATIDKIVHQVGGRWFDNGGNEIDADGKNTGGAAL